MSDIGCNLEASASQTAFAPGTGVGSAPASAAQRARPFCQAAKHGKQPALSTTITPTQLRVNFPAFANTRTYTDAQINLWLGIAYQRLTPGRWQTMLDIGAQLYTCHNLTLEARAQAEAANGIPPGGQVGPLNNKSVDKASAGFDVGAGTYEGAGFYNLTTYGTRFYELMQLFGMGPLQIGAGCDPFNNGAFTNATGAGGGGAPWPGPWPWLFPNQSNSG